MTQRWTMDREDSGGAREGWDLIVVGARVAGAATAMLAARRGLRVMLVDRRRPHGPTLSTHALMRGGVLQLTRWGLLERVRASGAPPVRRTTFHYGPEVETVELKPSGGVDALYAPRREVLDPLLVDAAEQAGAECRFGVSVDSLLRGPDGRVTGIAGRCAGGTRFAARSRLVVGADGLRSTVARAAGARSERRGGVASAIYYGYFTGEIADGYEFFYRPGVSAGLIPTNGGATCVWVGAPAVDHRRRMRRGLAAGFHRLLADAAPEALARVRNGRLESRIFGFPGAPSHLRQAAGPGWALVGDASHFKDPLSAHGMTDALRDAELLADAVAAVHQGVAEAEAFSEYSRTRDRLSLPLLEAADAVASYDWTLTEVREHLVAMSRAMKQEVILLSARSAAVATRAA